MKINAVLLIMFLLPLTGKGQAGERIYAHTDKSWYHTGEVLWFRLDAVDACSLRPSDLSRVAYVELLREDHKPLLQAKVLLNASKGNGSFSIPADAPTGRYILTAYTSWMRNFSAAGFFRKPLTVINTQEKINADSLPVHAVPEAYNADHHRLKIEIVPSKLSYRRREKVTLDISASTEQYPGAESSLSVSVLRVDSFQRPDVHGITSAMQTYRRCDSVVPAEARYLPEMENHIVTAQVTELNTGRSAANIRGYLSVNTDPYIFQTAVSDSNGIIRFLVPDFYGKKELVFRTNSADSIYRIGLVNPYAENHTTEYNGKIAGPAGKEALTELMISAHVQRVFAGNRLRQFLNPPANGLVFYGRPDASYVLNNFIRFSTVEEVLREYVTQVGVQRRGNLLFPFIYDASRRKRFSNAPLILVDGIPVFNVQKFMEMDPERIRSAHVVNTRYIMGRMAFDGIMDLRLHDSLSYWTSQSDVIEYDGFQYFRNFYAPVYETEDQRLSRLPDFRNVLYWSPDTRTNKNGKQTIEFYSSDLTGTYAVVIQGITRNGETGSRVINIEVK